MVCLDTSDLGTFPAVHFPALLRTGLLVYHKKKLYNIFKNCKKVVIKQGTQQILL